MSTPTRDLDKLIPDLEMWLGQEMIPDVARDLLRQAARELPRRAHNRTIVKRAAHIYKTPPTTKAGDDEATTAAEV